MTDRNYAAVAADTFSSELGILATSKPRLITAPWRVVAPGTNGGVTATGIMAGLIGSFIIAVTTTALTPFCSADNRKREGGSAGWALSEQITFMLGITAVGLGGSLLDSLLGALLQASVIDIRTGKVIEGQGGGKVLVHSAGSLHLKQRQKVAERTGMSSGDAASDVAGQGLRSRKGAESTQKVLERQSEHGESRKVATGIDLLSNNGVNFAMAVTMSIVAMAGAASIWGISMPNIVSDVLR